MTYKTKQKKQLYELDKEIRKLNSIEIPSIPYTNIYNLIERNDLYQILLKLKPEEDRETTLQLKEKCNCYSDLYDFIPFGCFILDQQGTIVNINEAGANLIGVKKPFLMNKNLSRYIAVNFQSIYFNHLQQAIEKNNSQKCEIKFLRKDGPLFDAQLSTRSVFNAITNKIYLLMLMREKNNDKYFISERKNYMVGFSEIISHELNHPLAVISNYLHGCIRRIEANQFKIEDIASALKKAIKQLERVNEIILKMKNFTCKGTMNYEPIDINQLIDEAISFIRHESLNFPITIHYYPIPNPPKISLDKIHIEQVIINLARNAIEAMKDAGQTESKIIIEANHIDISKIEICVVDNGPGISSDDIHKLFDPHFTSKPYGVGLGLAVSQKIIEAHGGKICAERHPLGGMCFKFTLSTQPINQHLLHTFGNDYSA